MITFIKKHILFLFVLCLVLPMFVNAEVRLDMPNTLTEVVPYRVTLIVNEPSLQKYTDEIYIRCSNCQVMIDEEDQAKEYGHSTIELRGRNSVSFYIVGEFDENEKERTGTVSEIRFTFSGDYEELRKDFPNENSLGSELAYFTKHFAVVRSKKDFTLPPLPSNTEEEFVYDDFFGKYRFYDKGDGWEKEPRLKIFNFEVVDIPCQGQDENNNYTHYCGSLSLDTIKKGEFSDGTKLIKQNMLGGTGYGSVHDSVNKIVEVREKGELLYKLEEVSVVFYFNVFNEEKKIYYKGNCNKASFVKEGERDSYVNEAISDCEKVLNSYVRKTVGTSPGNIPKDELDYKLPVRDKAKPTIEYDDFCQSDSDCEDDYSCTACGECKKSKNVYDVNDVEVEFEILNKLSSKSIFNTIYNRVKIQTVVSPTFELDGKKIDYCELSAPGLDGYELVAEMKNDDSYAGFTSGWLLDEREKEEKRGIDFKEKNLKFAFLVSPNDRKKTVGALDDVKEEIELRIEKSGTKVITTTEHIILKPITMDLDIRSSGQQVQQGSNKLVTYTVKNKYGNIIRIKGSLIGPGTIEDGKYEGAKFYNNIKPNEDVKIMYHPPNMGNFDIGKEIASLSMVDLQAEAAKQIAEDAFFAYTHEIGQNVEDAYGAGKVASKEKAGINAIKNYFKRNPDKYDPTKALEYVKKFNAQMNEEQLKDLVAKGYKLYTKTYVASKIPKSTVDMRDNMVEAASEGTGGNEKTYTETAAEVGVVGIDVLQTGFGILTFLPNKIPVVGKASAALQTSFSAATNIWKANFKYIAKSEKIDRAQEKFIPIMILITAEDESGWQQTKGYLLQVAYHEI